MNQVKLHHNRSAKNIKLHKQ